MVKELSLNPNSSRYDYINDDRKVFATKLQEFLIWYNGDSEEILNFFTHFITDESLNNPLYFRGTRNYFWSIAVDEKEQGKFKKVHSGMPKAIIDTIVNVVGKPEISFDESIKIYNYDLTNLQNIFVQQQLPLTLVEGFGAYKINVKNGKIKVEYYAGHEIKYEFDGNDIIGVHFFNYYIQNEKNYTLDEYRFLDSKGSHVEYHLYDDNLKEVSLNTIPSLEVQDFHILNYDKLLAVPTIIFYDTFNKGYGKSIFYGKCDLFDELDQVLSQSGQTVRVSTPVEYYDADIMKRTKDGKPITPNVFNRQFIKKLSVPSGDGYGGSGQGVITSQPQLNFEKYDEKTTQLIKNICVGILSPASMGFDVSAKDNALAQREKEKATLFTRDNIVLNEQIILSKLISLILDFDNYIESGAMSSGEYDIAVKFKDYGSPSFEEKAKLFSDLLVKGAISPELYVEKVWGDNLSEDEKLKEIARLKSEMLVDEDEEYKQDKERDNKE